MKSRLADEALCYLTASSLKTTSIIWTVLLNHCWRGGRYREKKRERERPLKEHICNSSAPPPEAQHHHVLPSCHAENISTFQSGGLPSAPLLCTFSVCLPVTPACLSVSPSSSIPLNWRYSKTQVIWRLTRLAAGLR